jgi:hypothetical protein
VVALAVQRLDPPSLTLRRHRWSKHEAGHPSVEPFGMLKHVEEALRLGLAEGAPGSLGEDLSGAFAGSDGRTR